MIDVKQAIRIAKEKAAELLDQASANVEGIERHAYHGREVWDITLSMPRDVKNLAPLVASSADAVQYARFLINYKRFLIDVETGELLAMTPREVASQ